MRVIGGQFKGRRFTAPSHIKARPTTDFAREGLFNLLTHRVELNGISVLDLFAGTGAVSYEFASRGAELIIAIDKDNVAFNCIKKNCAQMGITQIHTIRMDALRYVRDAKRGFDIVFADPPYSLEIHEKLHSQLMEGNALAHDGLFILEHSEHDDFSHLAGFLEKRKYGQVVFSLYGRQSS